MLKIAVLGSTRGTSMQPLIEAIEGHELAASIELVISNKPDAYILERAKKQGIKAVYISPSYEGEYPAWRGEGVDRGKKTRVEYDQEIMERLAEHQIDLVLLIGYMRLLSPTFVRQWKNKIMNVHPSLLPKFAGGMDLEVHRAVIAAGEKATGCTIHWVDEGVDTGEIIVQKKCSVEPNDTPESLRERVQELEGEAFIEAIDKVISHKS